MDQIEAVNKTYIVQVNFVQLPSYPICSSLQGAYWLLEGVLALSMSLSYRGL